MELLQEITRCPLIQAWFASPQSPNPCAKIIAFQHAVHPESLDQRQVPEPWSGNIQQAPILFLSSNPSIDEKEEYPLWSWPDQRIEDFFVNRFGGGRKQWIEDGIRSLRRGEMLALQWADVDLERQTVKVQRTVDYIPRYGYVETEPKTTAGRRTLMIASFVVDMLKQHHIQQLVARLKAGSLWEDRDLVITDLNGRYFNPRYLEKLFSRIIAEADLPHMRFHDLRHRAATLLLSMGVHVKVVQEILGHSNIAMTADH